MVDSKTSFDFIRVQSKLNKLVDDFMTNAGKTAVRIRPTPHYKWIVTYTYKKKSYVLMTYLIFIYRKMVMKTYYMCNTMYNSNRINR